jgi:hypothetical protein
MTEKNSREFMDAINHRLVDRQEQTASKDEKNRGGNYNRRLAENAKSIKGKDSGLVGVAVAVTMAAGIAGGSAASMEVSPPDWGGNSGNVDRRDLHNQHGDSQNNEQKQQITPKDGEEGSATHPGSVDSGDRSTTLHMPGRSQNESR